VGLLAPFVADPAGSAILLDVDGTLAPVVRHPELSAIPEETHRVLAGLAGRYGLVGCVSGRRFADLRRLVANERIALAGCHGLEGAAGFAPEAAAWLPAIAQAAALVGPVARAVGAWVEDKGVALNVHYREAPDPARAGQELAALAGAIEALGLRVRHGRMSLEVLPPVAIDKGTAVRRLVRESGTRRSLYAGDDATDVPALLAADLAIAVRSDESPAELLAAAAIVVDGPAGLLDLLRGL
jgi:trehalose 6-phosphate phosphatase